MTENTSEVQPETSVASDTVCRALCSFQHSENSFAVHQFADASLLWSTLTCSPGGGKGASVGLCRQTSRLSLALWSLAMQPTVFLTVQGRSTFR